MLLKGESLFQLLDRGKDAEPMGVAIVPLMNFEDLRKKDVSSLDLRLGRWFLAVRASRTGVIQGDQDDFGDEIRLAKKYFVPFGQQLYLHPGRFILGCTLEWIRLPSNVMGYVTGKSSWGRRGLIIETAAGIHPGFSGCLTLELANIGEVPIAITPGMKICQIFLHQASDEGLAPSSSLGGYRRPILGVIKADQILEGLKVQS